MAQRKPRITSRKGKIGRITRIKIEPNPERPIQLHKRDLLKREVMKEDSWWFTLHRRGIRRIKVGEDPLEARAVPHGKIRGTLPERIIYKYLRDHMHQSPESDFSFQTSLQGGRAELGGMVADFIFPYRMWVFRIQGPTHTEFIREKKDEEQMGILEGMGYEVFDFEIDVIYSETSLETYMREIFGLHRGGGSIAKGMVDHNLRLQSHLWKEIEEKVTWIEGFMANYYG